MLLLLLVSLGGTSESMFLMKTDNLSINQRVVYCWVDLQPCGKRSLCIDCR